MEKLESSSRGAVAVVILLLAVIALSLAGMMVSRRLLCSGCTACADGASLISLLAFRFTPKDHVRPAFFKKFALEDCIGGGGGAWTSSCRREAFAGFTFLSERASTEEGFVDELLSLVDEAALSY